MLCINHINKKNIRKERDKMWEERDIQSRGYNVKINKREREKHVCVLHTHIYREGVGMW